MKLKIYSMLKYIIYIVFDKISEKILSLEYELE